MSNYDAEADRLWEEYKEEQRDWTEDVGGEFSAIYRDEE